MKLYRFMKHIFIFTLLLIVTICNCQTMCVSGKTVNFRSTPKIIEGNILSKLNYGTKVNVIENEQAEWVKIEVNGITGYVSAKYLISCNNVNLKVYETKNSKTVYVLICNSSSAYAYHSYECRGLSRCRSSVSKVTRSEAESVGRAPCKICY